MKGPATEAPFDAGLLLEHIGEVVSVYRPDGSCRYVSPGCRELLGQAPEHYTRGGTQGCAAELIPLMDDAELRRAVSLLRAGAPSVQVTHRARHQDGTLLWLETDFRARRAPDTDAFELIACSRDVSARLRDQEHFRSLVENAPDGISLMDEEHALAYVSPAIERILGYAPARVLGARRDEFVHPEDREAVRYAICGLAPGASVTQEYRSRHADGSWRWLRGTFTNRLDDPAVGAYVINYADITAEREARLALTSSLAAYQALASFGERIETIQDVGELLDVGLESLVAQLRMDLAMVSEVRGNEVLPRRFYGRAPHEVRRLLMRPMKLSEGANGRAARSGEPVVVRHYPSYPGRHPEVARTSLASVLALPVKQGGEVRHVVALASFDRPATLGEGALSIAGAFVRRLENALERIDDRQELEATREATLRALGLALEYRDYETKGHTDRVVDLSLRFGRALGLGARQLEALTWGAYLHDLGKVAISDTILLKPGRLTDEEFAAVKRHTVIGTEMCRQVPFLPTETRQVVRSHHERWDGGGYPDGLAGEEIPLLARMFAVVDVYDALTSDRPYRRAWEPAAVRAHLEEQTGSHFDPAVMSAFYSLLDENREPEETVPRRP